MLSSALFCASIPHLLFAFLFSRDLALMSSSVNVVTAPSSARGLVLIFNYRTIFDSSDIDRLNFSAWQEVLDAFGYSDLTFEGFLRDLALRSVEEIMMGLCPMTTRAEWDPLLNKRTLRLDREIGDLCSAEIRPLDGFKDFVIDCARHCPVKVIFLSPFSDGNSRTLLERADVTCFVDIVHCYPRREFAALDALEIIDAKPPRLPHSVRHRWERRADDAPHPLIVAFEADPEGVRYAKALGVQVVGVSLNNAENTEELGEKATSSVLSDSELLRAGASCVVRDLTMLRYEFLHQLH
jgi:hypothetical protein